MRSRCGKVSISAHAPKTCVVCFGRIRGSRKTPQTLRQVAFGVATFDMHIGNDTSFTLQQTGYLGGQVPGKQTVPRAELWGAIQILSKVDGKSNIQIPIDAKYVTRSIAHRGDLVQGPNGDLWSILFQLIDERSGVTDFIKVKSHLEDAGPSVIKQNRIAFHHMLANSLADVVAEEAAKRLLPDLNLERKAKWAERVGVGVAKRLALVQADIWAKRSEAGDIYKLDPLFVEETTCTRTVFSTLVDELGPPRPLTGTSQQRSAMQSLQCVQSIQAIQILEQSFLRATAKRRRGHLPFPKQEKTAHQHGSRKLASRSRPLWRT